MTSTPRVRISSRLDSESRSAARTLIFWGLLSRALARTPVQVFERVTTIGDLQEKLAIFGARQPRRERSLSSLRETRPKFAALYRGVQRPTCADGERFGVEGAFTAVGKSELQLAALFTQAEHEEGHVLDPKVGPVVAVVQNEAAVVGVEG